jgi:hypothetical protein
MRPERGLAFAIAGRRGLSLEVASKAYSLMARRIA